MGSSGCFALDIHLNFNLKFTCNIFDLFCVVEVKVTVQHLVPNHPDVKDARLLSGCLATEHLWSQVEFGGLVRFIDRIP